ncbi:hypothetical protein [Nocardia concava]|uniref:hypothetical protein n=1 Tax=Nocardia concava TaxID=257281 RepID=UPI0012F93979|nr:hypothetical protein [Nocardia concava]
MEFALPQAEELWSRVAAEGHAFLNRQGDGAQVIEVKGSEIPPWSAGDRLINEDGSSNWFVLVRVDDNRALLFGGDESSQLFETDFDPWAYAPDWALAVDRRAPHPRVDLSSYIVTFVRWWDGSAWGRTPYEVHLPEEWADDPDSDDGLNQGLRSVIGPTL